MARSSRRVAEKVRRMDGGPGRIHARPRRVAHLLLRMDAKWRRMAHSRRFLALARRCGAIWPSFPDRAGFSYREIAY
jgi:hypothetical protein